MTAPDIFNMNQLGSSPSGFGSNFTAADLAALIHGAGQGTSNVLQSQANMARSRRDVTEARRRTQARLLNNALRRQSNVYRNQNDYTNELAEQRNNIMQDIARGFVQSLQGSTGR